jgi:hypothetical protein
VLAKLRPNTGSLGSEALRSAVLETARSCAKDNARPADSETWKEPIPPSGEINSHGLRVKIDKRPAMGMASEEESQN